MVFGPGDRGGYDERERAAVAVLSEGAAVVQVDAQGGGGDFGSREGQELQGVLDASDWEG